MKGDGIDFDRGVSYRYAFEGRCLFLLPWVTKLTEKLGWGRRSYWKYVEEEEWHQSQDIHRIWYP